MLLKPGVRMANVVKAKPRVFKPGGPMANVVGAKPRVFYGCPSPGFA